MEDGRTTHDLDMNKKKDLDKVSYGRLILAFKARIAPSLTCKQTTDERDLTFIEELWEYTPEHNDVDLIRNDFACKRLYRTSP